MSPKFAIDHVLEVIRADRSTIEGIEGVMFEMGKSRHIWCCLQSRMKVSNAGVVKVRAGRRGGSQW